jgi:hypothetical protein
MLKGDLKFTDARFPPFSGRINLMQGLLRRFLLSALLVGIGNFSSPALQAALPSGVSTPAQNVTYADLADLADSAPLLLRAQVRKQVRVEPGRAIGVKPGWARFYFEAKTVSLLVGDSVVGEALRYLADLPLDARGKTPSLIKKQVLLFAGAVPGRTGELRLVAPDGQLVWDPATESKLRAILTELVAADTPPRITGVREAIHVAGELAGQGETQVFLAARNSGAAAISVTRRAGAAPVWGVSFLKWPKGADRRRARRCAGIGSPASCRQCCRWGPICREAQRKKPRPMQTTAWLWENLAPAPGCGTNRRQEL